MANRETYERLVERDRFLRQGIAERVQDVQNGTLGGEPLDADDITGMMNCDVCGGRHRATFTYQGVERGWHELLGDGGWRQHRPSRGKK